MKIDRIDDLAWAEHNDNTIRKKSLPRIPYSMIGCELDRQGWCFRQADIGTESALWNCCCTLWHGWRVGHQHYSPKVEITRNLKENTRWSPSDRSRMHHNNIMICLCHSDVFSFKIQWRLWSHIFNYRSDIVLLDRAAFLATRTHSKVEVRT